MGAIHAALLAAQLAATPTATDVAALQYGGDADGALRAAERILATRPDDVTARLLGACAALEAGRLRSANDMLAPLERMTPPPPRASVLRALLERRIRVPDEPFMRALALAWIHVGRPDLREDEPQLDGAVPPLWPDRPRPRGAANRILFEMPGEPVERAAVALAAAEELAGAPGVVALQILGALAFLECPSDASHHNAAARRAQEAARRVWPGNGYVEVAAVVAQCPRRLGEPDVARLEEAAARPELEYPRKAAFDQILRLAERIDRTSARRRAISAWLALDIAGMQLRAMVEAEADPGLRVRAARAVERVGWRLADGSAWLERLVGLSLAQFGEGLSRDDPHQAVVEERLQAARDLYRAWSDAKARLGRWPFAAEWREWSPDEVQASADFLAAIGDLPAGTRP